MAILTQAFGGVGSTLGVKSGSSTTYTNFAVLADDFQFSGITTNSIPTPYLANVVLTKTPGRIDSGQFSGTLYYVPGDASYALMLTIAQARTIAMWQVMTPDGSSGVGGTTGSTATFSGFITSIAPSGFSGESPVTLDFEIEITGLVTFAVGS